MNHNPCVGGSSPSSATIKPSESRGFRSSLKNKTVKIRSLTHSQNSLMTKKDSESKSQTIQRLIERYFSLLSLINIRFLENLKYISLHPEIIRS